jgi:hypothetical protein
MVIRYNYFVILWVYSDRLCHVILTALTKQKTIHNNYESCCGPATGQGGLITV